eukprot:gene23286-biopygen11817
MATASLGRRGAARCCAAQRGAAVRWRRRRCASLRCAALRGAVLPCAAVRRCIWRNRRGHSRVTPPGTSYTRVRSNPLKDHTWGWLRGRHSCSVSALTSRCNERGHRPIRSGPLWVAGTACSNTKQQLGETARDASGTRPFLQNLSCGTRPGRVRDAVLSEVRNLSASFLKPRLPRGVWNMDLEEVPFRSSFLTIPGAFGAGSFMLLSVRQFRCGIATFLCCTLMRSTLSHDLRSLPREMVRHSAIIPGGRWAESVPTRPDSDPTVGLTPDLGNLV